MKYDYNFNIIKNLIGVTRKRANLMTPRRVLRLISFVELDLKISLRVKSKKNQLDQLLVKRINKE